MAIEIVVQDIGLNDAGPELGASGIQIISNEGILSTTSTAVKVEIGQEIAQGDASAIAFTPVGQLITATTIQSAMEQVVTTAYSDVAWEFQNAAFSPTFNTSHIIDPPSSGLVITLPETSSATSDGLFILMTVISDPSDINPIRVNEFGGVERFILRAEGTYYAIYHSSIPSPNWVLVSGGLSSVASDIPIDLSSATPAYTATNVKDAVLEVIQDAKEVDGGTF